MSNASVGRNTSNGDICFLGPVVHTVTLTFLFLCSACVACVSNAKTALDEANAGMCVFFATVTKTKRHQSSSIIDEVVLHSSFVLRHNLCTTVLSSGVQDFQLHMPGTFAAFFRTIESHTRSEAAGEALATPSK